MRVFRIAIPASRIDVSRAFYEQLLALDVDDTVPSRLYFHCGDVIIALIDWAVEGGRALHPTPDNIYLATTELDAVYQRALDVGARITSAIELRAWGERSFYCLDPDGNQLCFVDDTTLFLGRGAELGLIVLDERLLDEALNERERGVGDFAPAAVDRQ